MSKPEFVGKRRLARSSTRWDMAGDDKDGLESLQQLTAELTSAGKKPLGNLALGNTEKKPDLSKLLLNPGSNNNHNNNNNNNTPTSSPSQQRTASPSRRMLKTSGSFLDVLKDTIGIGGGMMGSTDQNDGNDGDNNNNNNNADNNNKIVERNSDIRPRRHSGMELDKNVLAAFASSSTTVPSSAEKPAKRPPALIRGMSGIGLMGPSAAETTSQFPTPLAAMRSASPARSMSFIVPRLMKGGDEEHADSKDRDIGPSPGVTPLNASAEGKNLVLNDSGGEKQWGAMSATERLMTVGQKAMKSWSSMANVVANTTTTNNNNEKMPESESDYSEDNASVASNGSRLSGFLFRKNSNTPRGSMILNDDDQQSAASAEEKGNKGRDFLSSIFGGSESVAVNPVNPNSSSASPTGMTALHKHELQHTAPRTLLTQPSLTKLSGMGGNKLTVVQPSVSSLAEEEDSKQQQQQQQQPQQQEEKATSIGAAFLTKLKRGSSFAFGLATGTNPDGGGDASPKSVATPTQGFSQQNSPSQTPRNLSSFIRENIIPGLKLTSSSENEDGASVKRDSRLTIASRGNERVEEGEENEDDALSVPRSSRLTVSKSDSDDEVELGATPVASSSSKKKNVHHGGDNDDANSEPEDGKSWSDLIGDPVIITALHTANVPKLGNVVKKEDEDGIQEENVHKKEEKKEEEEEEVGNATKKKQKAKAKKKNNKGKTEDSDGENDKNVNSKAKAKPGTKKSKINAKKGSKAAKKKTTKKKGKLQQQSDDSDGNAGANKVNKDKNKEDDDDDDDDDEDNDNDNDNDKDSDNDDKETDKEKEEDGHTPTNANSNNKQKSNSKINNTNNDDNDEKPAESNGGGLMSKLANAVGIRVSGFGNRTGGKPPLIPRTASAMNLRQPAIDRIAAVVQKIVSGVLGHSVGVGDQLLDNGVNSITALLAASELQSHFGIDVPRLLVFEAPTITDIANRIAAGLEADGIILNPEDDYFDFPAQRSRMQKLQEEQRQNAKKKANGTKKGGKNKKKDDSPENKDEHVIDIIDTSNRQLHRPKEISPMGSALSAPVLYLLQTICIFTVILTIGIAGIGAWVAWGKIASVVPSPLGMIRIGTDGTVLLGLLFPVVPLIFFGIFSVELILFKWIVVGRYKANCHVIWSLEFLRWWFIDRLVSVWERWVGLFLIGSPLMTVVYRALGARIAMTATVECFIREFDLVEISAYAVVKGRILPRQLRPDGLWLSRVSVGHHAMVHAKSVVGPDCSIGDGAVVERMAVCVPCTHVPPETTYAGFCHEAGLHNSLRYRSILKTAVPLENQKVSSWILDCLHQFVGGCTVLYILWMCHLPGAMSWVSISHILEGLRYRRLVSLLVAAAITAFSIVIVAVVLKWVLVGRSKVGLSRISRTEKYKRLWVDYLAWIASLLAALPWKGTFVETLYLKLYGAHMDITSVVLDTDGIRPSNADLVTVGPGALIMDAHIDCDMDQAASGTNPNSEAIDAAEHAVRQPVSIGRGARVGWGSFLEAGVVLESSCAVGTLTKVVVGGKVEKFHAAMGNPMEIFNKERVLLAHPPMSRTLVMQHWWMFLFRASLMTMCVFSVVLPAVEVGMLTLAPESAGDEVPPLIPPALALIIVVVTYLIAAFGLFVSLAAFRLLAGMLLSWDTRSEIPPNNVMKSAVVYTYSSWGWIVGRLVLPLFLGTKIPNAMMKLLGYSVSWNALIFTERAFQFGTVSIEDHAVLDVESSVMGWIMETNKITVEKARVCAASSVDPFALVQGGHILPKNSILGYLSVSHGGLRTNMNVDITSPNNENHRDSNGVEALVPLFAFVGNPARKLTIS